MSKAGVTLTHANGKITGSRATWPPATSIIITIFADVKATATGILMNEAEVSAPDEDYTLNNHDEVENPVTPKIDLAIDKIDSKDPVEPGETFSYIVTVKNNGPSNATGVTVVDTLPANVTLPGRHAAGNARPATVTFDHRQPGRRGHGDVQDHRASSTPTSSARC